MIQDRQILLPSQTDTVQYRDVHDMIQTILDKDLKHLNENELFLMPLCVRPIEMTTYPHKYNFVPWKLDPEEVHNMLDTLVTHLIKEGGSLYDYDEIYTVLKGNLRINLHAIRSNMEIASLYETGSITPEKLFKKAERYRAEAFKIFLEDAEELTSYRSMLAHSFEGGDCKDFVSFIEILQNIQGIVLDSTLENILKEKWNSSFDAAFHAMLYDGEIDFYKRHDRREILNQDEVTKEWEDAKMKAFTNIQELKSFLFSEIKEHGISLYDEEKQELLDLHFDVPDTFKTKNILELLLYINDMQNGATYQERFMAQHIVVNAFHNVSIEHSPEYKASRHLATQLLPESCFSLPEDPKQQRRLLLLEYPDGTWGAMVHCVSEKLTLPKGTKVLAQEIMRQWDKHPDVWMWFSSRTKSKNSILQKLTARGEQSNILSIQDFPDLNAASIVLSRELDEELLQELEQDLAENYLGLETQTEKDKYMLGEGEYTVTDTVHGSNQKNPNSSKNYGDIKVNGKRKVNEVLVGVEVQIKFLQQYTDEYKKNSKLAHSKYVKKRRLANIRHEFPTHLFKNAQSIRLKLEEVYQG